MSNQTSPEVTTHSPEWENWSGNIQYNGKNYYFSPKTKADLKSVLADAKAKGVTVRVSGQRHSQPALVTDDNRHQSPPLNPTLYLVDMSCYVDVGKDGMELGPGANQVTVNPGVREDDLDAFLIKHKLMMKTVTAGGFFSIGGMSVVDVHGSTIDAPIFAETISAFTIMNADGQERIINRNSKDQDGNPLLPFARVSLGALGIITRVVIDTLSRPLITTLQGGKAHYLLKDKQAFTIKFKQLLNRPLKYDRIEVFYTPYAAASNLPIPAMKNFLVLWWDVDSNSHSKTPNLDLDLGQNTTACTFSNEKKFGAPCVTGIEKYGVSFARKSQYFDSPYSLLHWPPIPPSGYAAIALNEIKHQVKVANSKHSELWLTKAAQVMFMSYFIELPALDETGLEKVWDGLQVVGDYVIQEKNFHIAAPMEFRFVKGGDSVMSGTYTKNPNTWFVNLDVIGFIEPTTSTEYPSALIKFFAFVERKWIEMGGLPHNGKMYGFYDPKDSNKDSFTPPFNKNFLSFITQRRIERGAPIEAFKKYRQYCDRDNRFYNSYLRKLLGD
ncbi:hypothetical protein BTHERMOSOX_725 [Bathymodiolus thermophilus thioautotrophic gill symbiont]|uniref:FAD-binding protein n=1 Tax=Bathymodiolus thermophilus thioautotrophic gill symbiont TaxID=2360 RepID=UPI0010B468BB|nr:FAD-binding protein [Bathymodiolus thermophilus thioautotrophic gill symbiont]SHA02823.1 hypothetical protein BTHERMOSOX_725 [Bathymodiolus thermophilus thioautotrophic gill symbiont]